MTPPELPDDPREWPKDPFALLGVERGADDSTIRRAYTQLIRKYKPEHHPDQFCKIREAFETCRQQAAYYHAAEPTEPAEESKAALPRWSTPLAEQPPSEADLLWKEAIDGKLDVAYAGLVAQSLAGSDDAGIALRLYWLLALDPKLDKSRTRHDWLFSALAQSQLGRSALELYRRELEADPAAALADPYVELLNLDARWPQLVEAARLRIVAAGRLGRSSLIEFDLKQVKKHVGLDTDADWLNLLVAALDWTAWRQPNTVVPYLMDELPALKHLELHHGYCFDRVDQTLYWGGETSAGTKVGLEAFFRLIGLIWATPGPVSRADLVKGLESLAEQPYRTLRWFDELFLVRGPNLGFLAVRMLARYYFESEPAHPADALRGYVRRVPDIRKQSWPVLRTRILDVLIRHRVHPEELAEACAADPEPRFREVSAAVIGDLSLHIAWLASCLCPASRTP